MKSPFRPIVLASALAVALVTFSGCSTCKPGKPGPIAKYNFDVALDQSLQQGSVLVDLVGVTTASLPRWESYSMTKYWTANDAMRNDADKKTFNYVSGKSLASSLPITDAIWARWMASRVTHVLVLADLPGAHTDKQGNQDSRRQIIPLDLCHWGAGTKSLNVRVQKSGIDVTVAAPATK